jgi:hypothetical protein
VRRQLLRWFGSRRLAMYVQRCEKTARSAMQVVRQQTAGSVGSGSAADGWQCVFRGVRRQQGQLLRWFGSRRLAMWVLVRQQTAGSVCSEV